MTPPGHALTTARTLAQDYAKLSPLAARMAKEAIEVSAHALAFATSHIDRDQFLLAQRSDDHAEALAAFMEKRAPRFGKGE